MKLRHLSIPVLMALSASALAGTFTLENNTHYLLFQKQDQKITSVVLPGKSVSLDLPTQAMTTYNFDVNAPNQSGNRQYSLTVGQNDLSKYQANKIVNMQTTLQDKSTLVLKSTTAPVPISYPQDIPFRGINLSGAESGSLNDGSSENGLPSYEDAVPYLQAGANTVRFPIRWAYINDQKNFNYLNTVAAGISTLLNNHVSVIVDLHNYMRKFPDNQPTTGSTSIAPVNTQDIATVWKKISTAFAPLAEKYSAGKTQLMFEIMNEPNNMANQAVLNNTNAAIQAIRQAGVKNLIIIDGDSWTGLHSWANDNASGVTDHKSNAKTFTPANIKDPQSNWAIAVHQYFDTNGPYSGTGNQCVPLDEFKSDNPGNGLNLNAFLAYVKQYKVKVFLDEFGVPKSASNAGVCQQDFDYLMDAVKSHPYTPATGGFIGWTAWQVNHVWGGVNQLTPDVWQQYYQPYAQG